MEPADAVAEEAEERAFWLAASASTMRRIWDNPGDDVYAELLDDTGGAVKKQP